MRKPIIVFGGLCLFLILPTFLFANNKVDSLELVLKSQELSVTERADTYLALIKALNYKGAKVDSIMELTMALAEAHDLYYHAGKAEYYKLIHWTAIRKIDEDYFATLGKIDSLIQLEENPRDLPIGHGRSLGYYYWWTQDYKQGIESLRKTLAYAMNNDLEKYQGKILGQIAHLQGLDNQFFDAIKTYQQVIDLPKTRKSIHYGNITNLYRRMEDWEKVLVYTDSSSLYADIDKIEQVQSANVIQRGRALNHLSRFEEAEDFLLANYDVVYKSPTRRRCLYFTELLRSYIGTEQWEKGLAIEDSLSTLSQKEYAYSTVLSNLGEIYLLKGQPYKTIKLCEEAKLLAQKNKSTDYTSQACKILHQAYAQTGQTAKAYEVMKIFHEAEAKMDGREKVMTLSRALNQQELKRQEEILLLEKKNQENIYQARLSRYQLIFGFGLAILGLGLFTIFQIRKRSKKIKEQNKIISKSLEEKEILLKEIHHRVKNNLQLVSSLLGLQGMTSENVEIKEAINAGKSRVMSMALIHQDLYNKDRLTSVNVKEYLEKLCKELIHTYQLKPDQVHLTTDIQAIHLDVDTLIPLGLIINELLTNALKYAFPDNQSGRVHVRLFEADDCLQLEVSDNGIGIDKSKESGTSFGLQLIGSLLEQLEGEMQTTSHDGTQFQFQFREYTKVA